MTEQDEIKVLRSEIRRLKELLVWGLLFFYGLETGDEVGDKNIQDHIKDLEEVIGEHLTIEKITVDKRTLDTATDLVRAIPCTSVRCKNAMTQTLCCRCQALETLISLQTGLAE